LFVFCFLNATYLLFWLAGAFTRIFVMDSVKWRLMAIGLLLLAAGILASQLSTDTHAIKLVIPLPRDLGFSMICVGICLAMPALTSEAASKAMAPIAKIATFLSAFSYSLYLIHWPILALFHPFTAKADSLSAQSAGIFALKLIASLLGGYLFYLLTERNTPVIRAWLRRRFSNSEKAMTTQ